MENFPAGKHDDEVEALSGAHEMLRVRLAKFEH
jgi:phage terminase large subunit-like protein